MVFRDLSGVNHLKLVKERKNGIDMNMVMDKRRYLKMIAACAGVVALAACSSGTPSATTVPAATSASTATQSATAAVTEDPATTAPAATQAATDDTAATTAAQTVTKLNLNTATAEDFLTIPNVGQRMVREFMEYRPYTSIQQFRREIGKYVDAAQVAEYEKYVYVPVSPNDADAATLQQLPGVDQATADKLIAARPYDSGDAFLKQLARYVTPEQLTVAGAYVAAQGAAQ
jgi:DNA uptake protein ComE-like DNA-binding protein